MKNSKCESKKNGILLFLHVYKMKKELRNVLNRKSAKVFALAFFYVRLEVT